MTLPQLARLAWRHDKGGALAVLLIPAALWIAAMMLEIVR